MDLLSLSPDALTEQLVSWGQPRFRAKQIREWVYERGVRSFDDMTNLPKSLREELATKATIGTLTPSTEQRSSDGTIKRLYRLPDGKLIETVLMVYGDGRRTACISTQAGCAMGCVFCATGQMGFARHLTQTEIFEQAFRFAGELQQRNERLSNVVLMGMGEPLHNYDASVGAMRRLMSDLGIGARRITVSTVGLVPQINRLAEEGIQVTLAISLHAATNAQRSALLPVNRRYDLDALIGAARSYAKHTGRRVTFEWALIAGQNDSDEEAARLGALLSGLNCHVNLIPLNPTAEYGGTPTDLAASKRFVARLASAGIPATVRVRRGIDIDAGCGQLTSKHATANP